MDAAFASEQYRGAIVADELWGGDEQLIVRHDWHAGRPAAPFNAIEISWFADAEAAVAHAAGGRRLVAVPNRVVINQTDDWLKLRP
jgi:hypothetical protein